MSTQGAGPRRTGSRSTGMTAGVLAVVAIVVVAAIVIGLNMGGSPGTSPTPFGSPSAGDATPTEAASPTASTTPTAGAPSAPDLAWERLDGRARRRRRRRGHDEHQRSLVRDRDDRPGPAIWTSDDAIPRTWAKATLDTPASADHYAQVTRVLPDGDNLMAFGSWGVTASEQYSWITWRSTDGGATWAEARRDEAGLRTVTEGGPGFIGAGWDSGGTTPFDSFISDERGWDHLGAHEPGRHAQQRGAGAGRDR